MEPMAQRGRRDPLARLARQVWQVRPERLVHPARTEPMERLGTTGATGATGPTGPTGPTDDRGNGTAGASLSIRRHRNTAIGFGALVNNTSGQSNTAIGPDALSRNTTGAYNIALGYLAGNTLIAGNNNIYIGNIGVNGESNTIRIGDPAMALATYIAGINGVDKSSGNPVFIDANGQLGTGSAGMTLLSGFTVSNLGNQQAVWIGAGSNWNATGNACERGKCSLLRVAYGYPYLLLRQNQWRHGQRGPIAYLPGLQQLWCRCGKRPIGYLRDSWRAVKCHQCECVDHAQSRRLRSEGDEQPIR